MFTPSTLYRITLTTGLLMAAAVSAQETPLRVSAKTPVLDETGAAIPQGEGAFVQIVMTGTNALPPDSTGLPQGSNKVVFTTRIGNGVSDSPEMAGRFSAGVTPTPAGTIIVRVFNRSTLESSSFYADSQPFTPSGSTIFNPVFASGMQPLDPADDDGDGLHNSWEKSFGSNSARADSDGDGLTDFEEFRAGTHPADPASVFRVSDLIVHEDGQVEAEWPAVSGRTYRVQYVRGGLNGTTWSEDPPSDPVRSSGSRARVPVALDADPSPEGFFRVWLVD